VGAIGYDLGDAASVGLSVSPTTPRRIPGPGRAVRLSCQPHDQPGQHLWPVGGSHALSAATALDLTRHDSDLDQSIAVLSPSMDFSLR
jgi:hypothetical protein